MTNHVVRRLGLLISFFLFIDTGDATIMKYMSIGDLTAASDMIVIGQIVSIKSTWNTGHTMINTDIVIKPETILMGDSSQANISFRMPGGLVGDTATVLIGAPSFHSEEEVVLFLGYGGLGIPESVLSVPSLSLGKFVIHSKPDTKSRVVSRDLSAIHLIGNVEDELLSCELPLETLIKIILGKIQQGGN